MQKEKTMEKDRWLRLGRSLGLEFWLPLPLLGILFWWGSTWMTHQILGRTHPTPMVQVQGNPQLQIQLSLAATILELEVVMYRSRGLTEVMVKTTGSSLRQVHLEIPKTDFQEVEQTIARDLGLSRETVRKLARYQIQD